MAKTLTERIIVNQYAIAKNEIEVASLYLSDAYNYVPVELYRDLRTTQEFLAELANAMQKFINNIENSGQPEKNKEEKENG